MKSRSLLKQYLIVPLILVSLISLVISCSEDPALAADKHFKKGVTYLENKKYKEAEIEFKNSLQNQPTNAEAHYQLAIALGGQQDPGKIREILSQLQKTIQFNPEHVEARVQLAEFLLRAGKFDDSVKLAERALEIQKDHKGAIAILAKAYEGGKKYKKALEQMDRLAQLLSGKSDTGASSDKSPAGKSSISKPAIMIEKAVVMLKMKRYADAEKLLNDVIKINSDSDRAYIALGDLHLLKKETEKAESAFIKALAINPGNIQLYHRMGRLYLALKQKDKAEKNYLEAVAKNPDNIQPALILGDFYLLTGKGIKAREVFTKAADKWPDEVPPLQRLADYHLSMREMKEARKYIETLSTKHPEAIESYYLKGRLALFDKQFDEAEKNFSKLNKKKPGSAPAKYYLGLSMLQKPNPDIKEVRLLLEEAVKLEPRHLEAQLALGRILVSTHEYALALQHAEMAEKARPNDLRYLSIIGDAYIGKKAYKKALSAFKKLTKAVPSFYDAYLKTGIINKMQGNNKEAVKNLEQVLKLKPNHIVALSALVGIETAKGKTGNALKRAEAFRKKNGDGPRLFALLAQIYLKSNQIEKAEKMYNNILDIAPENLSAYMGLAKIYMKRKEMDKAIEKWETIIKKKPEYLPPYMMIGTVYELSSNNKKATEYYKKALEIQPDFAPVANNLAWIYSQSADKLDLALTLAQTAKEKLPSNPMVSDTLGWIYYKKGIMMKSISLLEEAASKMDTNGEVLFHLGMAYYKKGKKADAVETLTKSIAIGGYTGIDIARNTLKKLK